MHAFVELLQVRGYSERLLINEPMANHTTIRVGGPADWMLVVTRLDEMIELVGLSRKAGIPAMVVGGGSNILVADKGIRGFVIINRCEAIEMPTAGTLECEAGVPIKAASRYAIERGWECLEWACGVPGTVGGAVVGNAGAYGGCIADNLAWADLLHTDGRIECASAAQLEFSYRSSVLKRVPSLERPLVLRCAFNLKPGDTAELERRAQSYTRQRTERIPSEPSAGSVFKRTLQFPAGFLVEQCGLKGYQVGGAQVSKLHANVVINTGNASAADVAQVINHMRRQVWENHGLQLELEIEFVGDWPAEPDTRSTK